MENTEQTSQTSPPVAPTPVPAANNGGGLMKGVLIFLGIGLVVGLIIMLMRKSTGTGMMGSQKGQQGESKQQDGTKTIIQNVPISNVQGSSDAVAVFYGTANNDLKTVQNFLNDFKNTKLTPDGILGPATAKAMVEEFTTEENKKVALEIQTTQRITDKQMKWLLAIVKSSYEKRTKEANNVGGFWGI